MQKNWYAVYIRPHCEKKVALTLAKKKIETFCPVNSIKLTYQKRKKIIQEPLFSSFIFVRIVQSEIHILKQVDGIINLLYWMKSPAIIKDAEIEAIKEFTGNYFDIKLEQSQVNTTDLFHNIEGPSSSMDGNVYVLKNKVLKINLPSIGYNMIAKMEEETIFTRKTNILQNNSFVHS
jgi:transcription termination/antitermination protein NusG